MTNTTFDIANCTFGLFNSTLDILDDCSGESSNEIQMLRLLAVVGLLIAYANQDNNYINISYFFRSNKQLERLLDKYKVICTSQAEELALVQDSMKNNLAQYQSARQSRPPLNSAKEKLWMETMQKDFSELDHQIQNYPTLPEKYEVKELEQLIDTVDEHHRNVMKLANIIVEKIRGKNNPVSTTKAILQLIK